MTQTQAPTTKTIADMPSPEGVPLFGDSLPFLFKREQPFQVIERVAREVGPIARADMPGADMVMVSDPAAITQIMVTDAASYYKDTPAAALRPVSTDEGDVFTQPGGKVWAERMASNPMVLALKGDWLGKALPTMQQDLAKRVDTWIGQEFEHTYGALLHMSFDVFSNMLYGEQFKAETFRDWVKVADELDDRMKPSLLPMSDHLKKDAREAQDHIQRKFVKAVRMAKDTPDKSGTDLLRYALRAGCDHDDSLLATELANMYYGGIVSSSTAVVVTLYLLVKSDAEKEKVQNALIALGPNPTAEAINGCSELQAAVLEALRLLPPVSLWTRSVQPTKSALLGEYTLAPNTSLMIGNRFAHTDPAHWDEPKAYRPGRWTPERRASDPLGSAWFFPFGRGERTCLAQQVALAYIHLAVATILMRTDPHIGLGEPLQEDFWFGCMIPKDLHTHYEELPG